MYRFPLLASLLVLFLAGCSNLQQPQIPTPATDSWQTHQQQLKKITRWQINGKIGIRTTESSHSASLFWLQLAENYQIDIRGPWGQGGASIKGKPGDVIIDIAGDDRYRATSPERLLEQHTGWQLPISDIYWWIRGLPAPDSPYQHTLSDNRLLELVQNGWLINYSRYNNALPALPRKIVMQQQSLKITLILNQWQLNPQPELSIN